MKSKLPSYVNACFFIFLDDPYGKIFDLSDTICVLNKTENANVKVFDLVIGFNELKLLLKPYS